MQYHRDKEYMTYVGHLIQHPKVQKLADIPHHIHSNRLEHSIHVSYTSYKLAKKFGWDAKSTARGGLLHDLFYYDWRETKFTKSHAWIHPRIAVRNARKITDLNAKEEDIIIKYYYIHLEIDCLNHSLNFSPSISVHTLAFGFFLR